MLTCRCFKIKQYNQQVKTEQNPSASLIKNRNYTGNIPHKLVNENCVNILDVTLIRQQLKTGKRPLNPQGDMILIQEIFD